MLENKKMKILYFKLLDNDNIKIYDKRRIWPLIYLFYNWYGGIDIYMKDKKNRHSYIEILKEKEKDKYIIYKIRDSYLWYQKQKIVEIKNKEELLYKIITIIKKIWKNKNKELWNLF